jgi:hypothetical protein
MYHPITVAGLPRVPPHVVGASLCCEWRRCSWPRGARDQLASWLGAAARWHRGEGRRLAGERTGCWGLISEGARRRAALGLWGCGPWCQPRIVTRPRTASASRRAPPVTACLPQLPTSTLPSLFPSWGSFAGDEAPTRTGRFPYQPVYRRGRSADQALDARAWRGAVEQPAEDAGPCCTKAMFSC